MVRGSPAIRPERRLACQGQRDDRLKEHETVLAPLSSELPAFLLAMNQQDSLGSASLPHTMERNPGSHGRVPENCGLGWAKGVAHVGHRGRKCLAR